MKQLFPLLTLLLLTSFAYAQTSGTKNEITKSMVDSIVLSNKIVLLEFSATWCKPCQEMIPVINEVEKENQDVKIIRLDYDINRKLATDLNVYEIPFIQVYIDGKISDNVIGVMEKNKIVELLRKK